VAVKWYTFQNVQLLVKVKLFFVLQLLFLLPKKIYLQVTYYVDTHSVPNYKMLDDHLDLLQLKLGTYKEKSLTEGRET